MDNEINELAYIGFPARNQDKLHLYIAFSGIILVLVMTVMLSASAIIGKNLVVPLSRITASKASAGSSGSIISTQLNNSSDYPVKNATCFSCHRPIFNYTYVNGTFQLNTT